MHALVVLNKPADWLMTVPVYETALRTGHQLVVCCYSCIINVTGNGPSVSVDAWRLFGASPGCLLAPDMHEAPRQQHYVQQQTEMDEPGSVWLPGLGCCPGTRRPAASNELVTAKPAASFRLKIACRGAQVWQAQRAGGNCHDRSPPAGTALRHEPVPAQQNPPGVPPPPAHRTQSAVMAEKPQESAAIPCGFLWRKRVSLAKRCGTYTHRKIF